MDSAASREHWWPAALGGDESVLLPAGAVCRSCNNALGILDQRLSDEFDQFLLDAGVRRRDGKAPVISNRGNFIGNLGPDGPCIEVNLGPQSVVSDGRRIPPPGRSPRNLRPRIETVGNLGKVSVRYELNFERRFVRALYKIGLGAICHYHGVDRASETEFDGIRAYVRRDEGSQTALVIVHPGMTNEFGFEGLWTHAEDEMIAVIRLGPARFVLDLLAGQRGMAGICEAVRRNPALQVVTIPV